MKVCSAAWFRGTINPQNQTGHCMNKILALLFAAACLSFIGCGKKENKTQQADTSTGNPLTAPVDYVGAIGKAQQSATKTISTLGIDQAIKAFAAEEGRFPKDLNELVSQGTIPSIPKPPTGMKYDYDPATGRIKLVPQ